MEITLRLQCRDLRASAQFYDRIFWTRPNTRRDPNSQVQTVTIGNGMRIKLIDRRDRPATECSLELDGFDVMGLYAKIRGHIPEYEGPVETLPNGHCWGPYEYPGGNLLVIRDLDGHDFSFVEW